MVECFSPLEIVEGMVCCMLMVGNSIVLCLHAVIVAARL